MMMKMMTIILNGEPRPAPVGATLPELVESLGLPGAMLLIEHNGTALHREEWVGRPLMDGDRLEVLRVAAGG